MNCVVGRLVAVGWVEVHVTRSDSLGVDAVWQGGSGVRCDFESVNVARSVSALHVQTTAVTVCADTVVDSHICACEDMYQVVIVAIFNYSPCRIEVLSCLISGYQRGVVLTVASPPLEAGTKYQLVAELST